MSVKLKYKKAEEKDIDFLFDLRMKTMTEHYISSNLPTSRESTLERILYRFEKAHIIILDSIPVGLLKIDKSPDNIEVIQLQINPAQQGRGIGKTILQDIIKEAALNSQSVSLSVLKTNKAQKLYASLGFTITGDDEHSYFMRVSP